MKIERAKKMYEELNHFQMTLARDPVSLGPKYLHDCIATLRNWTNRVSMLLMEVHEEKQQLMKDLDALEGAYEIDYAELLSTDERVTGRSNIKDREAAIKTILRDQLREIQAKKREIADLAHVEKAIKHRHKEIRDTIGEVREQRALIRAEIDTGAMYGDERESSTASIQPEDIDEDELSNILDSSGIEPSEEHRALPAAVEATPAVVSPGPTTIAGMKPETVSGPLEAGTAAILAVSPATVAPTAELDGPPANQHLIDDLSSPAEPDPSVEAFLGRKPSNSTKSPVELTDEDLSLILS